MSGGSGTGYPVMNRGLRCVQTGRSESKRGMEEAQTAGENKMILLFQGRRGVFFFSLLFFLQVQSVVRSQLRVLSGAASSAQDPSAGSLGGLGVKVCFLSTFCHEKRKTAKRAFLGRTPQISKMVRVKRWMDLRKNQNNPSETINIQEVYRSFC